MVASTEEFEDHFASGAARVTFFASKVEKSDIFGITFIGRKSL